MEVFLPDVQRYPVPNVRIEKLIFQTESGDVNQKVSTDELNRLKEELNGISAKAFKESTTSFEVLIQFRLTPSSNVDFKMQTTGGEKEDGILTSFYNAVSKINRYQSIKDDVLVVFHYKITPTEMK
ncbi:hypothetical protein A7985_07525 [Pseudoalteromonas luteoviolacea]|uniref:Uncharacterized protein n=2 Tax=Pseudoalteromonas luteoviolacea TaxID=43657 RepID=A0A1C0TWT9_9GAMM|nr:hypothetical protein A7985_07525 [Pseudoalteromonas luteoviolacea]